MLDDANASDRDEEEFDTVCMVLAGQTLMPPERQRLRSPLPPRHLTRPAPVALPLLLPIQKQIAGAVEVVDEEEAEVR